LYNTKEVPDKHLDQFYSLYVKYQEALPTKHSKYGALLILANTLKVSKVFGLYKDQKLVGFIIGNPINKENFYFSGIYIEPKHTLKVKQLLNFAESEICKVYNAWYADSLLDKGKNLLSKFGAKLIKSESLTFGIKETYRKGLNNG
jgi:hypothetical protein